MHGLCWMSSVEKANKFGANIASKTLLLLTAISFEVYEFCSYTFAAAMPKDIIFLFWQSRASDFDRRQPVFLRLLLPSQTMASESSFVAIDAHVDLEEDDDDAVKVDAKTDTALEQGKAGAKKADEEVEASDIESKQPKVEDAMDEEGDEEEGFTMLSTESWVQIQDICKKKKVKFGRLHMRPYDVEEQEDNKSRPSSSTRSSKKRKDIQSCTEPTCALSYRTLS